MKRERRGGLRVALRRTGDALQPLPPLALHEADGRTRKQHLVV